MAKLHTVLGPQVHSLKEMTVGRFYHVVDDDGEHVAVRLVNPMGNATVVQVDRGVPCGYEVGDTVLLHGRLRQKTLTPIGKVFKFAPRPDTVRYRGKKVESASELTTGRWYILVRGDKTLAGKFRRAAHGKQGYFEVPGVAEQLGHVITGEAGEELRETYKFTEVPKMQPKSKPQAVAVKPRKAKKGDFVLVRDAGEGNKVSDGEVVKLLSDLPYSDETMVRLLKSDGSQAVVFSRRVKPVQFADGFPVALKSFGVAGDGSITNKQIGATEGDKFVVVNSDGHFSVDSGDIVVLSSDDGSFCPWFKPQTGKSAGEAVCIAWWRLARYAEPAPAAEPEPVPFVVVEPAVGGDAWKGKNAKDIGAKEGDRFVVVDDSGRQDRVRNGDVVELSNDDGSTFPWFKVLKGDNADDTVCLSFSRLAPEPLENQPTPEEVSGGQVMAALAQNNALAGKARAVGLLANEVEKRYNAAQEAIQAHTVANEAYQNALMDLLKLSKEATANETLNA